MSSSQVELQVTDAQLAKYADLVYSKTGIRLSPQKKTLLSNRVRRRLRETGIASFEDYYRGLCRRPSNDPEWDAFLQEITTHETYLFRDEQQWDWFRTTYLPQCAAEARDGKRPKALRIWSAACSTGDEASTIASCIAACLPNFAQWAIQIVGTDIGVGAVEQAKAATFNERAMRLVPDDYKQRYFVRNREANTWQAKPALTDMMSFRQHNLMDPLRERPFDLVLVKNVLIYFDPDSKRKVVDHVLGLIKPNGLLIAGAAEGVSDLLKGMERIHPWLYRNVSAQGSKR